MFVILPLVINFGLSFSASNINPLLGISNIINLSLWMSLAFGLTFQMPLVVYSLVKSGFVEYETFKNMRPYVIVGILVVAGILTPPDILSQISLFLPAYLLLFADLVQYDETSKTLALIQNEIEKIGEIAICTAGTGDVPVAEEAARTAQFYGSNVKRYYDIGVAGVHRLFDKIDEIKKQML